MVEFIDLVDDDDEECDMLSGPEIVDSKSSRQTKLWPEFVAKQEATASNSKNVFEILDMLDDDEQFPDMASLFNLYDQQFFEGLLATRGCIVEWSKRLTSCAGICYYKRKPTLTDVKLANKSGEDVFKDYPKCIIRLSEPLLSLRPAKDMKETLAHEMIHAFCFINGLEDSRDGHGSTFQRFMNTINKFTGEIKACFGNLEQISI